MKSIRHFLCFMLIPATTMILLLSNRWLASDKEPRTIAVFSRLSNPAPLPTGNSSLWTQPLSIDTGSHGNLPAITISDKASQMTDRDSQETVASEKDTIASSKELQWTPPSGKELQWTPPSGKELQWTPPSGKKLQWTHPSSKVSQWTRPSSKVSQLTRPSSKVSQWTHRLWGKSALSQEDIEGVEKFLIFVGYRRSGHSFIGSLMDAHPNMIIAHEFYVLKRWSSQPQFQNKTHLFNQLFRKSWEDATYGERSFGGATMVQKGYSFKIDSLWQADFTKLRVIGEKGGGSISDVYCRSSENASIYFQELVDTVKIPIRVMYVVRNPYDMIATAVLYSTFGQTNTSRIKKAGIAVKVNESNLMKHVDKIIGETLAVAEMIERFDLAVLEVHSEDFINDPKSTVQRICDFLEVECPEEYLQACRDITYPSISRTRDVISWSEEALSAVESAIDRFPAFRGYSFNGIDWNP